MEKQRYDYIFRYEMTHWWYKGRQVLLQTILKNTSIKRSDRVLDYGCGTGANLRVLNNYAKAEGADTDSNALAYCKKRRLDRLHKISGNTLPFIKNSFKLITCLDVLEHIKNDTQILDEFHRILKPRGTLILFVPAFPSLWGQLDVVSHHQRRYTQKELRNKIKIAGFSINQYFYFNYLFFLPIFLIRKLQQLDFFKRSAWGIQPTVGSKIINKLFYFMFLLDVKTAPFLNPPFGISIAVIAQKKHGLN